MYVSVVYYNDRIGGYSGRNYTYRTNMNLKSGDKVMASVGSENKRAMVIAVDIPESEIDPAWADKIKEITSYDYTDMTPVL